MEGGQDGRLPLPQVGGLDSAVDAGPDTENAKKAPTATLMAKRVTTPLVDVTVASTADQRPH